MPGGGVCGGEQLISDWSKMQDGGWKAILPSCIFDQSEMSCSPPHTPPPGIELSLLHYYSTHSDVT